MKKIVSVLLISAMLVTALTACNNDNSSNSNDNSTSNTSTGNSTSDNSTDNSTSDNSTDSSAADNSSDDSTPESTSLFNLESCEEFCFSTNIISAQLKKLVVIKPKDGKESEISTAIDTYYDGVKNDPNIAFYPMQQASADGAVKGVTDDGYYYVIVHENGEDIETAMLAAASGSARAARTADTAGDPVDEDFGGFADPGLDDDFGVGDGFDDFGTFEDEGVDNSELPFPENKAGEMVKAALAADVWPAMDIVDTQQFVDIMFYVAV